MPHRASRHSMPHGIAPLLAVSSDRLPKDSGRWAFEFKWECVRAVCFWDGKQLRLRSRNKLDITRRYPELHCLAKSLPRSGVVLDGEIIALDANHRAPALTTSIPVCTRKLPTRSPSSRRPSQSDTSRSMCSGFAASR
jgi:hypothetical protein